MTLLTVLIAQAATLLERYVRVIVYINACVIVCVYRKYHRHSKLHTVILMINKDLFLLLTTLDIDFYTEGRLYGFCQQFPFTVIFIPQQHSQLYSIFVFYWFVLIHGKRLITVIWLNWAILVVYVRTDYWAGQCG